MYYFIGIKGAGMASLACMLYDIGHSVSGSDISKHIFTEDELSKRNIQVVDFDQTTFLDYSTVIVGNAFSDTFSEVVKAKSNPTIKVIRYHDFLGELMTHYNSIAISGSHGKTTTTAMVSTMLASVFDTGFLIGDGVGKLAKDDQYLVIEACEYRRHFLSYYPNIAVITNVDLDHVDYFKSLDDYVLAYEQFGKNIKDVVFVYGDEPLSKNLKLKPTTITYGFNQDNDLIATNIHETRLHVSFDVIYMEQHKGLITLPFVGEHMILNSLAAIGIGLRLGLTIKQIEVGLSQFKGAKRRFVIEEIGDDIFIDDYAHHPTEIKMTILAAKKRYPDKKIVAIFKPHRVSRVFTFADEFASALSLADHVALCEFNSIDDAEEGIDIDIYYLANKIKNSQVILEDESGAAALATHKPAVFLFMSSKDIYVLSDYLKRYQNY